MIIVYDQYETGREFDLLALPEAKAAVVQELAAEGRLDKIDFFEGLRQYVGAAEIQSIYWRAEVDGKVIRGEIRLDFSNYLVELVEGWGGMTVTDWEVVPEWAFHDTEGEEA